VNRPLAAMLDVFIGTNGGWIEGDEERNAKVEPDLRRR